MSLQQNKSLYKFELKTKVNCKKPIIIYSFNNLTLVYQFTNLNSILTDLLKIFIVIAKKKLYEIC